MQSLTAADISDSHVDQRKSRSKACLSAGYSLSLLAFAAAVSLIYLSEPCGYQDSASSAITIDRFHIDLMNRSAWVDWAPIDYAFQAYVVVYNTDFGPYFGSVLSLGAEPTAESEFAGFGVYVLYLGWPNGDYWLTVLISLWWLVVVSLAFPFVRAIPQRVFRFSLLSAFVGLTLASVCFAFPQITFGIILDPVILSVAMACLIGIRLAYDWAPQMVWGRQS